MWISSISVCLRQLQSLFLDLLFPKRKDIEILEKMPTSYWKSISQISFFENIRYILPYHDENVRRALWEIKYGNNKKLQQTLIRLLCESIDSELHKIENIGNIDSLIVTYIPMSKSRNKIREINFSEIIAKELAKYFTLNFQTLLSKKFETERQTTLKRKARIKNIVNSFEIYNEASIKNMNIILVDDVTTTGATLSEAKRVLLKAEANNVFCIALAH